MAKRLMVLLGMLAMTMAAAIPALAQEAPQYGEAQYADDEAPVPELTGVIEKPELTTYMYGTHSMTDELGNFYALESDIVDLDAYVGQRVTVSGAFVPGYEDGQVEGGPPLFSVTHVEEAGPGGPPPGPMPGRSATLSFELAVECEPPAGAAFFGNVQTGEGGPGIFAELLDPDGDGLYTGVATLPDRFGPGPDPVPPGVEPVSLAVQIVQGTGTRSAGSGTFPGEPTVVVRDFGVVPIEAENTFSAGVSFCNGTEPVDPVDPAPVDPTPGVDEDGNGSVGPVVSGDTANANKGGSGSVDTSGGGTAKDGTPSVAQEGGASPVASVLPATGGILPVAAAAGALLILGGLVARRIFR